MVTGYIDDTYQQGDTFGDCLNSVVQTVNQFQRLGFCIHPVKSALIPKQTVTFLGFVIDSAKMQVSLTSVKADKIAKMRQVAMVL